MSSFLDTVDRAGALLAERGRISLRGLRRALGVDAELLEDLVEELIEGRQLALRDGSALVWRRDAPQSEHAAERRQLTVMFCDLVDSTELAERVDPEELREILREYRGVCVEATKRFEGHIAQYLGDGVMIYFGYPQAHEDDAARAIRAALEIRRLLGERPAGRRIDARIGIHTGLVVVDPTGIGDDALALGATSNVAARIEGIAQPGTVVASDATLALCRGGFITRNLGDKELKGVEAPVRLHEVERIASVRTAAAADATGPMVGRDRELSLLLERWEAVQTGRGQVVLVSGEPGMGKSRLMQALREALTEAPHMWLDMQCSPFTSGSAFQPVVDLFDTAFRVNAAASPDEASGQLVSAVGSMPGLPAETVVPYLLALLGLPASERYALPQTSAEEQRKRTLSALVQLNHTLSEQQPVVLVAEDLHWSDPSTLEYLRRTVEQAPTSRLLLVLTFRPEFAALWSEPWVSALELEALSGRATREMLTHAAGGRLPEPVLAVLEKRSDGVPLFVEELASSVVNSGVLTERAGRYELQGGLQDLAIPATLQDSLMARLDRLSASKKLAQQAATLGREFSYELIEAVTDLDPPSLRGALGQLVAAEVVRQRGAPPNATYAFKHVLLQDTAYESQLLSTRRVLHGKIAEVLEERFPKRVQAEPEMIARHCAAAGAFARAVDHYQRAAELAVARLANEEASEYYGRALDALTALPEKEERHQREIAIRVAQGVSLSTLRGYEAPELLETIARIDALCDAVGVGPQQLPARVGLLQLGLLRGNLVASRPQAEAILRIAEPLGIQELVVMTHALIGGAALSSESALEAERLISRALAIAERLEFPAPPSPYAPDLVAMTQLNHAVALAILGRSDQAMLALQRCRERPSSVEHHNTRIQISAAAGSIGFLTDDPELARSVAEEALALVEGRGFHNMEVIARIFFGWARASLGEVEDGVRDVEEGLSLLEFSGSAGGVPLLYVAAAQVYRLAGRRKRAEGLLDRATSVYERTGEKAFHPIACSARARVLLELGDGTAAEAERLLLEACESASALDNLQWAIIASTQLARLAPGTGNVREAHDRLAGHYARLTEGLGRGPAREAAAALDELSALLDG